MTKFWRVARKTVLYGFAAIVALSLAAGLLVYLFQDDIKAMAVKEVNRSIQAKIIISGSDIDITFFSTFPDAAIEFRNFKIMEPGNPNAVLAQAAKLDFDFSPLDLINKQYHIRRILLKDADIKLKVNENGEPNYNILKPDSIKGKDTASVPLDIKLERIHLKDVKISYDNLQSKVLTNVQINDGVFAGSFTDAQYELKANMDMGAQNLSIGNREYLKDKAITVDASVAIDNAKNRYEIGSFKFRFENATYSARGYVAKENGRYRTALALNGEDAGIQTLVSLLPSRISTMLKDYRSTGQINFSGRLDGYFGKDELPGIDFKFGIVNGAVRDSKHSLGLEAVKMNGEYSNGKNHDAENSFLHVSNFTAKLNGHPLQIHYNMDNFKDPEVDAGLYAWDISLKDLANFITIPGLDSLGGAVQVDAVFKGKLADLEHYGSISRTRLQGKMTLNNVSMKPTGQKFAYRNMSGLFQTDGNNLEVSNFVGQCGKSDFQLDGVFKNLASFLFLPNQALNAKTDLHSHFIDMGDFMVKSNGSGTGGSHFSLPAFMYFNFNMDADKLVFGKFEAENLTGSVATGKNSISVSNLKMSTMSGNLQLNGDITDAGQGRFLAKAHAQLKGIDVKQCFYEFENFGQDYFTDKYISGRIDADVQYQGLWNSDLSPDTKSIVCDANVTVYDGEVNQFPPFIRLGKYLKVKSLDDVHFSEYTNRILISNRVVTIPQMDIKSSAVNISLAGTHTFDNVMDYHLKVNMSQLLFGAKQDYEDEFGEVEVDKSGGLNVFLTMKGPVSNYEIKYDAKSSMKNIGAGLAREGSDIKKIFKSSSPNAKPGEDLNNMTEDAEQPATDSDNGDNDVPKQHARHASEDSARNNAFKAFKNKLKNNSH